MAVALTKILREVPYLELEELRRLQSAVAKVLNEKRPVHSRVNICDNYDFRAGDKVRTLHGTQVGIVKEVGVSSLLVRWPNRECYHKPKYLLKEYE